MGGGTNLNVSVRYRQSNGTQNNPFPTITGTSHQTGWDVPVNVNFSRWGITHSVRFGYNRNQSETRNRFAYLDDVAGRGILGVSTDPFAWGVPTLSFSSVSGLRDINPSERTDQAITLGLGWMKMKGRQSWRWGLDFRDSRIDSRTDSNPRGAFVFTGLYTGGGSTRQSGLDFADFLLGLPQQATEQYGPGLVRLRAKSWSLLPAERLARVEQPDRQRGPSIRVPVTLHRGRRPAGEPRRADRLHGRSRRRRGPDRSVHRRVPGVGGLARPQQRRPARRHRLAAAAPNDAARRLRHQLQFGPLPGRGTEAGEPAAVCRHRHPARHPRVPLPLTDAFAASPPRPRRTTSPSTARTRLAGCTSGTSISSVRSDAPSRLAIAYTGTKGSNLDILRAPNRGPSGLRIAGVQPFIWESSGGDSIMHWMSLDCAGGSRRVSRAARPTPSRSRWTTPRRSAGRRQRMVAQNDQDLAVGVGPVELRPAPPADRRLHRGVAVRSRPPVAGRGRARRQLRRMDLSGTMSMASGTPSTARVVGDAADVAKGTNGTLRADFTGATIALANPTIAQYFNTAASPSRVRHVRQRRAQHHHRARVGVDGHVADEVVRAARHARSVAADPGGQRAQRRRLHLDRHHRQLADLRPGHGRAIHAQRAGHRTRHVLSHDYSTFEPGAEAAAVPLVAARTLAAARERGVQQPGPTFRSRVELVTVNVVVRDKTGRVVRDLTRDDFTVVEDGRPQKVSTFAFEQLDTAAVVVPLASIPTVLGSIGKPVRPQPHRARRRRPAPTIDMRGRRLIVLLFDMSSMQTEDLQRAVASAREFVEKRLTTVDTMAVVVLSTSLYVVQDFTDDQALLRSALGKIDGTEGMGFEEALAAEEAETGFTPDDSEFSVYNTDRRLEALRSLTDALAGIDQKKSIIYFSSGMTQTGLDNRVAIRTVIDRAVRANTSIYAADMRGLQAVVPGGDASSASVRGQAAFSGRSVSSRFDQMAASQDALASLAEDTGGRAFFEQNDFEAVFERVVADTSAYYVLGYSSTNPGRDGRFRRIRVTCRRPDVKLEYRAGYYAPRDFAHSGRDDREQQLIEQLMSDLSVTDLPVYASSAYFRMATDRYLVPVWVVVPGSRVPFKASRDKEKATIDVFGVLRDEQQRPVGRIRDTVNLSVAATEEVRRKSVQYQSTFELPPGQYRLKVVVRENQDGSMGSFESTVIVPNLAKDPSKVSSVVVGTQLRGGVKSDNRNPLVRNGQELVPNVARVISGAENLYFYYEVYDAARADSAARRCRGAGSGGRRRRARRAARARLAGPTPPELRPVAPSPCGCCRASSSSRGARASTKLRWSRRRR